MSHPKKAVVFSKGEGKWISFNGSPSRIVGSSKDFDGLMDVSTGVVSPGGGAKPHAHDFDEGFYLKRGTMDFTAGNRTVIISEGGFINIRGGVGHYPTNRSGKEAEVIVFCAPGGFDKFQAAVGIEMESPSDRPAPKENLAEIVRETAPQFGITMDPADKLFEKEPDVTIRNPDERVTIAAAGDLYRFLATSENTGGRYALWHATVLPGGGPGPHLHTRESEFFYLLSGEVYFESDGESFVAGPDTAIILPPGTRHFFKNQSDQPAEMLIAVTPGGCEGLFLDAGRPWEKGDALPDKPSKEEMNLLLRSAESYGIEIG